MLVSSTSPTNLSLIGSLTTEIYYRTGITGKTRTQTATHTQTFRTSGPSWTDLFGGGGDWIPDSQEVWMTHRLNLILSPYDIGSSKNLET